MGLFDRKPRDPHGYRFQELAGYNDRVSKGIVHTPEYVARMADEQRLFHEWADRGFRGDPPLRWNG